MRMGLSSTQPNLRRIIPWIDCQQSWARLSSASTPAGIAGCAPCGCQSFNGRAVAAALRPGYRYSMAQIELATDVMFKRSAPLRAIFQRRRRLMLASPTVASPPG
jgi:hypothetical protein